MTDERLFPHEVTSPVPRVTIVGNEQVKVEQHRGLTVYQPDKILFRAASGQIRLTGSELRFLNYGEGEATVVGVIESVAMEYAAGGGKGS